MLLRRWNPYNELRRMDRDLGHMWRWAYPFTNGEEEMEEWTIPLDVKEGDDNFVVHATLPGIKPEDIEVTVDDYVLTIKGKTETEEEHKEGEYLMRERRVGTFHRALRLPDRVDVERAETAYENGVLTVTFPKVEAKRAKHLKVAVEGKALEGAAKTEETEGVAK